MNGKHNNFRLGLTVIIMFALFVGCLLYIGGKGLFHPSMRELTVRLAAGPAMPEISQGSLVTCFGRQVGKVISWTLKKGTDPRDARITDAQFLEVRASVREDLDLRADCLIVASGPPLGGKGNLEIVNRGVAAESLKDTQIIHAGASGLQTALAQLTEEFNARNPESLISKIKLQLEPGAGNSLIAKIHVSLDNIARMTGNLAAELDRRQDSVLLAKVHAALDQVNAGLSEIVEMVETARPHVDHILASADNAMTRVDEEIIDSVTEELDRDREGSLLTLTHQAMSRLNQSLEDLNTVTGEAERTVVLNAARIDQVVLNVTEASALIKRGVKDVFFHPYKLFAKPSGRQKLELENIDIAREFADAAARLDDAAIRLKALADAEGPALSADDEDLRSIRMELQASVEAYSKAEAALWKRLGVE